MKGAGDEARVKHLTWKRGGKKTPSLWKPGWARVEGDGNEHAQIDMPNVPPHLRKTIMETRDRKTFLLILFASEGAMDILDSLMRGGEMVPDWQYPANAPAEYFTHIGAGKKVMIHTERGRVVRWVYKKGHDHYLACERMAVVCMVAAGYLKPDITLSEPKPNQTEPVLA